MAMRAIHGPLFIVGIGDRRVEQLEDLVGDVDAVGGQAGQLANGARVSKLVDVFLGGVQRRAGLEVKARYTSYSTFVSPSTRSTVARSR